MNLRSIPLGRLLARLAGLLLVTCLLSGAGASFTLPLGDDEAPPAEKPLVDWLKGHDRGKLTLNVGELQNLRTLVETAQENAAARKTEASKAERSRLQTAYLDLASLELIPKRRASKSPPNPLLGSAREVGQLALHALLDEEDGELFAHWLAEELLLDSKAPIAHRVVAASLFEGRHLEFTREPLLSLASGDKNELLRKTALKSLIGWPNQAITTFVLNGLDLAGQMRVRDILVPLGEGARHLELLKPLPMPEEQQVEILTFLRPSLISEDWRETSRALELSDSLTSDEIYPTLIDSLEVWLNRRGTELASRRIESDIIDTLSRRSNRHLRDNADRWRNWWNLVQAGKVPPPAEEGEEDGSRATFFSLRPVTQRVTFIIDRSGSMSTPFGGNRLHTRLNEAYDQTIGFLQLSGADTEFNVILFGDDYVRWKPRLQLATERNLVSLREWLDKQPPSGGTHLREAVEEALELRRDGTADLGRLASDTIIVLCDGVTVAGEDWVVPTLAGIKDSSRLVFNCVQIGTGGDACLQLLARESGGDFIHIKN